MAAAQEGLTHVLCDDATRQLALRSATFYRLDPIQACSLNLSLHST